MDAYQRCIDAIEVCLIGCERLAGSGLPDTHAALLGKLLECTQACELAVTSLDRRGSIASAAMTVAERLCDDCRRQCLTLPSPAAWACAQGCARAARICREFRASMRLRPTSWRPAPSASPDVGRRPVGFDLRGAPIRPEPPRVAAALRRRAAA